MPIYQYSCLECKAKFELIRRMDSDPNQCPKCGAKSALSRIPSASNFHLSGSGWHKTDYPQGK